MMKMMMNSGTPSLNETCSNAVLPCYATQFFAQRPLHCVPFSGISSNKGRIQTLQITGRAASSAEGRRREARLGFCRQRRHVRLQAAASRGVSDQPEASHCRRTLSLESCRTNSGLMPPSLPPSRQQTGRACGPGGILGGFEARFVHAVQIVRKPIRKRRNEYWGSSLLAHMDASTYSN